MNKKLLVWWVSEADFEDKWPITDVNPFKMPDYAFDQLGSLHCRAGRARLWVPSCIDLDELPVSPDDPRFDAYMECGGIVVYEEDAYACALWGGKFTDLELNPVEPLRKAINRAAAQKTHTPQEDWEKFMDFLYAELDCHLPIKTNSLLTGGEQKVMAATVLAWNAWVRLDRLHPDEEDEFQHSLNALQAIVMARPVQREFNLRN